MTVALDTNVLVYAEGIGDRERVARARDLVGGLSSGGVRLPIQVLGELFNVLVRKAGVGRENAREAVLDWMETYDLIPTSAEVLRDAVALSSDYGLQIWDAVILAAARSVQCEILLSEDMSDGFEWKGVTVRNPFRDGFAVDALLEPR